MKLQTDISRPIYSTNGNYRTVLNIMNDVATSQANGRIMSEICKNLNVRGDLSGLIDFCAFLYAACPFVPHIGKQDVRTLNAMMADKRGNCVEYTTAIASFCKRFGLPCTIRAVSFSSPTAYSHVFPVVDGLPFDLVIGQEYPEKDNVMKLGETKKYRYFTDLKAN